MTKKPTPQKYIKDIEYRNKIKEKIIKGEPVNIVDFAKYMRFNPTYGEYIIFHEYLEKRSEKFRRQHIIKPFIADFYCHSLNLVIEIDGSSHENKLEYDKRRELFLINKGIFIARVPEKECKTNLSGVVSFLADVIKYLYMIKRYGIKFQYGVIFSVSPLVFGEPEILKKFSKKDAEPVEDVFEDF